MTRLLLELQTETLHTPDPVLKAQTDVTVRVTEAAINPTDLRMRESRVWLEACIHTKAG